MVAIPGDVIQTFDMKNVGLVKIISVSNTLKN